MNSHARAIFGMIAVLLVLPPGRLPAQARSINAAEPLGAIVVQVTDTSLNPLPAEVRLPALGVGVQLSEEGTVTFARVPAGLYLVEVRHQGHASDSRLLRVTDDTARVEFVLSPAADERGGADAAQGAGMARARLRYFIDRSAEISTGVFITRNEIERRAARTVTALLRGVRDVSIQRAGGRTIVRSTRAPSRGCADGMLVFVDGDPVPDPGATEIDRVRAASVAAVEIYPSPGSTPPEFQRPGAECGVVLIWTAGV